MAGDYVTMLAKFIRQYIDNIQDKSEDGLGGDNDVGVDNDGQRMSQCLPGLRKYANAN